MASILWRLAVLVCDPLGLWRYLLIQPALAAAGLIGLRHQPSATDGDDVHSTKLAATPTKTGGNSTNKNGDGGGRRAGAERTARELAYRATILAMGAAALIWAAVFMYLTFYYTYMPAVEHVYPVRMQYDACNHDTPRALPTTTTFTAAADSAEPSTTVTRYENCEFPHAFVRLDVAGQPRMRLGQSYKIHLHIDMPDSPRNRDLGMFMVCASVRDGAARLLDHACRAAMMPYRSELVRTLRTWLLSPLYVLQMGSEQQLVEVELFEAYGLDQRGPVRDVYVELQSRHIQFYNVTLHVVAHFSGLRYAMWQWPLLSALVGIATNLLFILGALALSYYNWAHMLSFEQRMRQRLWLPGRKARGRLAAQQLDKGTSLVASDAKDRELDPTMDGVQDSSKQMSKVDLEDQSEESTSTDDDRTDTEVVKETDIVELGTPILDDTNQLRQRRATTTTA